MIIKNLKYAGTIEVPEKKNVEFVSTTKTYALGDGLWSIEALDSRGCCLKEFVGSNGQCFGEEADDLWAEYSSWADKIAQEGYSYRAYKSPDGTVGSYSYFVREVARGNLHGCILQY